jgi:hypothetical protein
MMDYSTIQALAHNKESSASAEKPVENLDLFSGAHNKQSSASAEQPDETGTIINAPIEVKKGATMEENNASATLTGELQIKKPVTSSNPVSENCLQTTTSNAKSLCLTTPVHLAYETGAKNVAEAIAKDYFDGRLLYSVWESKVHFYHSKKDPEFISMSQSMCSAFTGHMCQAGVEAGWDDGVKKVEAWEGQPPPATPCKGPAGTNNGISSTWVTQKEVNGKCVRVFPGHYLP